jgi:predicted transcriptional regulator YheO
MALVDGRGRHDMPKTSVPRLKGNGLDRSQRAQADANRRLRVLAEIIGPLTRSLGPNYEIVLHNYRLPDRRIVAVAGKITERRVSSELQVGLSVIGEADRAQDHLNYLAKGTNGRIVKCSTIVLRDDKRKAFGALCISLDVTAIRHAAAVLHTLSGQHAEPKPTTFSNDIRDVIDMALREVLAGRAAPLLSRDERLEVFSALDVRGIFSVKRAMSRVAASLGVSRATAYACLQAVRVNPAWAKPAKLGLKRAASIAS